MPNLFQQRKNNMTKNEITLLEQFFTAKNNDTKLQCLEKFTKGYENPELLRYLTKNNLYKKVSDSFFMYLCERYKSYVREIWGDNLKPLEKLLYALYNNKNDLYKMKINDSMMEKLISMVNHRDLTTYMFEQLFETTKHKKLTDEQIWKLSNNMNCSTILGKLTKDDARATDAFIRRWLVEYPMTTKYDLFDMLSALYFPTDAEKQLLKDNMPFAGYSWQTNAENLTAKEIADLVINYEAKLKLNPKQLQALGDHNATIISLYQAFAKYSNVDNEYFDEDLKEISIKYHNIDLVTQFKSLLVISKDKEIVTKWCQAYIK